MTASISHSSDFTDLSRSVLLLLYAIGLVLTYEVHIYAYYPAPSIALLGVLAAAIVIGGVHVPNRTTPALLASIFFLIALIGTQLIRILIGSGETTSDLAKTMMVASVFSLYFCCSKHDIERIFFFVYISSVVASIFNLLMFFAGGKLLLWEAFYGTRYASVFFLHNIAAAIFGFQLIYSAYASGLSRWLRIAGAALACISVLLSFSKGTIVAVALALLITAFSFSKKAWRIFPLGAGVLVAIVFVSSKDAIESAFPQFRFFSGLNERDEMWAAAFSSVDSMAVAWLGGGEALLHSMIGELGKDYLSTHNYYIDTLVSGGFISLVSLLLLTAVVLWGIRYRSESKLFFAIALYLVISANKSRFSLGGVTLLSALLSFCFAYAFQTWRKTQHTACK